MSAAVALPNASERADMARSRRFDVSARPRPSPAGRTFGKRPSNCGIAVVRPSHNGDATSGLQVPLLELLRRRAELAELVNGRAAGEKVNGLNGSASILSRYSREATPVVTCGLKFSPEAFGTNAET